MGRHGHAEPGRGRAQAAIQLHYSGKRTDFTPFSLANGGNSGLGSLSPSRGFRGVEPTLAIPAPPIVSPACFPTTVARRCDQFCKLQACDVQSEDGWFPNGLRAGGRPAGGRI
jgi:hypothetical protein